MIKFFALLSALLISVATPSQYVIAVNPEHDSVSIIAGETDITDFRSRLLAVRNLGSNIHPETQLELIVFLRTPASEDPLDSDQLNAVKNDVMITLIKQDHPHPDLGETISEMFFDKDLDEVWRDYCLQHLPAYHDSATDTQRRDLAVSTLWEGTKRQDPTFAGTALLALRTLHQRDAGIDQKKLGRTALDIARDTDFSNPSRITSVQVAASLNTPGIHELARSLVTDPSSTALLRASALSALSDSSDPEDVLLLERYSTSSDVRLRMAARAALAPSQ